jgi:hypothetical protein
VEVTLVLALAAPVTGEEVILEQRPAGTGRNFRELETTWS